MNNFCASFIFLLLLTMSFSSCKKEFVTPESDASLSFFARNGNEQATKVITLSNGNTAIVGKAGKKAFLLVLSPNNEEIFYHEENFWGKASFKDVLEMSNHNLLVIGDIFQDTVRANDQIVLQVFEPSGKVLWTKQLEKYLYDFFGMLDLPNGNVLLFGDYERRASFTEMDMNGNFLRSRNYKRYSGSEPWASAKNAILLPNGNLMVACATSKDNISNKYGTYSEIWIIEISLTDLTILKQNTFYDILDSQLKGIYNYQTNNYVVLDREHTFDTKAATLVLKLDNSFTLSDSQYYDLYNPQLYVSNSDEMILYGNSLIDPIANVRNASVIQIDQNLSLKWYATFGGTLNSQQAVNINKSLEGLDVISTSIDSENALASFAFYSLDFNGKLKQ